MFQSQNSKHDLGHVLYRILGRKNVYLIAPQNEYKILLKSLEDDLLMRLSSAGDNILSDSALVENLEHTKQGRYSVLL